MKIKSITAREILDSRGNPTIEAVVFLVGGGFGISSVPSGASDGIHEAKELRDGNKKYYNGLGVSGAIRNIQEIIAPDLIGLSIGSQQNLDARLIALDGTASKKKLGANAILAVSMAFLKASANSHNEELYHFISSDSVMMPVPLMNVINGGKHAPNSTDFQEFMIVPHGFSSFSSALKAGTEVYHTLKSMIYSKGMLVNVGDEGGFSLQGASNEDALEMLVLAIERSGYEVKKEVGIAIDCAASEFYEGGIYQIGTKHFNTSQAIEYMEKLIKKYNILSIEDPLAEDDWEGFKNMTARDGSKVQIVGDDLFVTNAGRLERGVANKCANSIIIKPNQIGTVTEAVETIHAAQQNNYAPIVSHRSGETNDSFVADLAVAYGCGQVKFGAPARGERLAKYNRLLEIEANLGKRAKFAQIF